MHRLEDFLAAGEYPGNRIIDRIALPPAESYSRAQVRRILLEGTGMMMVLAGKNANTSLLRSRPSRSRSTS
jgi:hypothetical protein